MQFWRRSKAQTIRRIRGHFAALGFPIDTVTDDEIERGALATAAAVGRFGLTQQEAADRVRFIFGAAGKLARGAEGERPS